MSKTPDISLDIDELSWSHLDAFRALDSSTLTHRNSSVTSISLMWDMFETTLILILVGISSAILSYLIFSVTLLGDSFSFYLINYANGVLSVVLCISWSILLALFSCYITQTICPDAVGGGLPEIRTILSGTIKPILLSGRLIIAKTCGYLLARIAGLSVGAEGPHIHISCAIADKILHWKIFERIRLNDGKRLEILACASAAGVSSSLGTAFGGVLFSIEVTCTTYMVRNLPRAFLTANFSLLVLLVFGIFNQIQLFESIDISLNKEISLLEMIIFAMIGFLSGIFGVLFVVVVEFLVSLRNNFLDKSLSSELISFRRYLLVFVITLIASTLLIIENSYGFDSSKGFPINVQNFGSFMFDKTDYDLDKKSLFIYFIYKFFVTSISVTLPLPVGLFSPVFLCGGVWGRLVGALLYPTGITSFHPCHYAIIGAAAFSTGVTRAISTALIAYELIGEPKLRVPLSIAIICAYFIGNRFTKNVYDVIIDTNGTPYLQEMPREIYAYPVSQVMQTTPPTEVLSLYSSYRDAKSLLDKLPLSEVFPVVYSTDSMVLIGAVLRSDIRKTIRKIESAINSSIEMNFNVINPNSSSNRSYRSFSNIFKSKSNLESESDNETTNIISDDKKPNFSWIFGYFSREYWEKEKVVQSFPSKRAQSHSFQKAFFDDPIDPLDNTIEFMAIVEGQRKPVRENLDYGIQGFEIDLDLSPYQIVDTMHLIKLDNVFRLLKLNQAYVTQFGRLVGIVSRSILKEYIGKYEKKPIDRCLQLLSSFCIPARSQYRIDHPMLESSSPILKKSTLQTNDLFNAYQHFSPYNTSSPSPSRNFSPLPISNKAKSDKSKNKFNRSLIF